VRFIVLAVAAALVLVAVAAADPSAPGFRGRISRIDAAQAKRMTGVSWRPGCPVSLRDLRLLRLSHRGFDGRVRTGRLVVHRDVAREVVAVFRRLYLAGFRGVPEELREAARMDGASEWRVINDLQRLDRILAKG